MITAGSQSFTKQMDALAKAVRSDISDYAQHNNGKTLFKEESTNGLSKEFYSYWGLMFGSYTPDGADPGTQTPNVGNQKKVTVHGWTNGVAFTEKSNYINPDQLPKIRAMLAESYSNTIELQRYTFYYYALEGRTTATVNGRNVVDATADDGLTYFNDAHTYKGSEVTNRNIPSADQTWSVSGRENVVSVGRNWKTPQNTPCPGKPKRWIVGQDLDAKAPQALKSALDPETANNAENLAKYQSKGMGLTEHFVWPWLPGDEFMLEYELSGVGWMELYLSGYKNKMFDYTSTSGIRRVVAWEVDFAVTGVDFRQYVHNRTATA